MKSRVLSAIFLSAILASCGGNEETSSVRADNFCNDAVVLQQEGSCDWAAVLSKAELAVSDANGVVYFIDVPDYNGDKVDHKIVRRVDLKNKSVPSPIDLSEYYVQGGMGPTALGYAEQTNQVFVVISSGDQASIVYIDTGNNSNVVEFRKYNWNPYQTPQPSETFMDINYNTGEWTLYDSNDTPHTFTGTLSRRNSYKFPVAYSPDGEIKIDRGNIYANTGELYGTLPESEHFFGYTGFHWISSEELVSLTREYNPDVFDFTSAFAVYDKNATLKSVKHIDGEPKRLFFSNDRYYLLIEGTSTVGYIVVEILP